MDRCAGQVICREWNIWKKGEEWLAVKLSEKLYAGTEVLWKEAKNKPFLVEMAKGTLDESRFHNYMIQDFLYLKDYIDILKSAAEHRSSQGVQQFLQKVIAETEGEVVRVHIPNLRKAGITDDIVAESAMADVIISYGNYMKQQMAEGLLSGLTALLQCSWAYAYIGQNVMEEHVEEIAVSPYRSWFLSYTCPEYVDANREWIELIDQESADIGREEEERLCGIFAACAKYENRLWDYFYRG